jgi:hypothetical protein
MLNKLKYCPKTAPTYTLGPMGTYFSDAAIEEPEVKNVWEFTVSEQI